jgi:hypothetical protein
VLDDENTNLSPGKKLLLEWHYRFGHLNFARVKHLLCHVPFFANKFAAAIKDDTPIKCHVCRLAKQSRRPNKSKATTSVLARNGALKDGFLCAHGKVISGSL